MPDFTPPSPYTFSPDNLSSSLSSPKIVDIPKIPPTPPSQTRKPRLPSDGVRRGDSFVGKVSALDQPLPPVPTDNPRASVVSTDSGIGPSAGGEIRRTVSSQRPGSSSVPSSGDGKFCRLPPSTTSTTSKSDGGKFDRLLGVQVEEEGDPEELDNYAWFWGCMSRQDCEKKLQSEGKVGNFVVRINANGNYIMSFWYVWEMAWWLWTLFHGRSQPPFRWFIRPTFEGAVEGVVWFIVKLSCGLTGSVILRISFHFVFFSTYMYVGGLMVSIITESFSTALFTALREL